PRLFKHVLLGVEGETHRTHAHRGSVAPAVVRGRFILPHPLAEVSAETGIRIATGPVEYGVMVGATIEDRIGNRYRQHRVVGEMRALMEQREVLRLHRGELVDGSDDVAGYGSFHAIARPIPGGT